MTSPKTHYCKFCGATLDANYRCWDADCKFAGIIQVATHKARFEKAAAQRLRTSMESDKFQSEYMMQPARSESPREAGAAQTPKSQAQQLHKTDSHTQTLESPALCDDEGCPHHGTPHVCVTLSPAARAEVAALEMEVAKQKLKLGESTRTIPMHAGEELKLQKLKLGPESQAYVVLNLNRAPTDHERVSLELMIRLFLKGYADAR